MAYRCYRALASWYLGYPEQAQRWMDDAVTYAYITNLTHLTISSLDVGLLISDPRISDLALTLISPTGTRVLLFEDRGALSTNGLGIFLASHQIQDVRKRELRTYLAFEVACVLINVGGYLSTVLRAAE